MNNDSGDRGRVECPGGRMGALAAYLTAKLCAARYDVSHRHWTRLVDAGKAPQPTRLGRSLRWSVETLIEWERSGCSTVRTAISKRGTR